jgi:hypothetical protein
VRTRLGRPTLAGSRQWARKLALATGALTAGFVVLVQACTSESVTGVAIGSVSVSPSSSVVMEGLSVQFDAIVYDEAGTALPTAAVSWSSDDASIASVDGEGLSTGVATGQTTIRASFNGSAGSAGLTVQPGPGVGVEPPSATLHGGASGSPPAPVTLRLTEEGGGSVGALSVTVAYPGGAPTGWLTAALSTTTLPADLTLSAAPGALGVGKHRATVSVAWSSPGEAGGVGIPVTLSLTAFTVTQTDGATRVTEAGTTDSVWVVLESPPASEVRLLVTSADPGEATASPAVLTFTPTSWATPQSIAMTGVDDREVDGDETTVVTVTVDDASSDPAYRPAVDRSVSVVTVDDDAAGLSVSETHGSTAVTESGTSDSLEVVLRTRPSSNVVVRATASDQGEAIAAPTVITFRPVDWDVPRTVTVTGVDDALVDGSQTSTITLRVDVDRSDPTYRDVPDAIVTVVTSDDDGASLSISQSQGSTVVTEAGSTDAFTVVLTAQPSGDVVVLVTSADVGEATVGPSTLTFTAGDWSTAQPVSVHGVDDAVLDGAVVTPVTIAVDRDLSAPEYGSAAPVSVAVTTLDDDAANFAVVESDGSTAVSESGTSDTFTITLGAQPTTNVVLRVESGDTSEVTVSPASLSFTPGNWGQPQTVAATGVDDDVADGSQETLVSITVDAAASDDAFDALAPKTVLVTTVDDDAAGFTITTGVVVSISEDGGTAPLTVVLDARPDSVVRLTFVSQDPLVATVAPAELMFTPSTWSTSQSVTVSAVNDDVVGGDRFTSVLVAVDDSASDDGFDGVADQTVQVTVVDDDGAGFTLADTAALTASEAGGTDAFTVVLDSSPISSVVLSVSSADVGEVTVSPATLTFTSANWNAPQAVTLTGVDDAVVDGPQVTSVTVAVVDALSQDAFDGLVTMTAVTTTDDDGVGITLADTTGLTVTEAGTTDAFTVVLAAEPSSNVVLSVTSGDTGEVTVSPVPLTFTATDWNVPRAVTLSGVDDAVADGDRQTEITVTVVDAQSDAAFAGLSAAARATTTDDDAVGITVSTSALTVAEGGTAATFDVRLDSEPTENVVVVVRSLDEGEVAVTPASLTFTPSDWSVPQDVTVTGVTDATVDGDEQTQVVIEVDPLSSDPAYAAVPARVVTVTTTDVDTSAPAPVRP